MNIKDPTTEQLAAEVAALAGESRTGAIRQALRERRERLRREAGVGRLTLHLEVDVWPGFHPGRPPSPPFA